MKTIGRREAIILALCGFTIGMPEKLFAQLSPATTSGIEWTGYLDFYYQTSPQTHSSTATFGPSIVEGRFFDRHTNQMTLNMAEISVKKKVGKVAFRADLAFGEMVDQLSGGGSQSVTSTNSTNLAANEPTRNVTQAILTYTANDRLSFTAGKFYSHVGLEVTKAKDNWQYSRSFTYNYAIPFWHEGVSGTYVISPNNFSATLYGLNAWDGRISQEVNKATTLGANLNYTGTEGLVANYNYIGGAETGDKSRREVHELNATYVINPTYIIAVDYVLGSQNDIPAVGDVNWSGVAVYLKAVINDFYTISPRVELLDDSDNGFALAGGLGSVTAVKQKITSVTLTNSFQVGDGLESRLEFRSDKSDSDQFFKNKDSEPTDHQESYSASLLYSF